MKKLKANSAMQCTAYSKLHISVKRPPPDPESFQIVLRTREQQLSSPEAW